ncbi:MAG: NADH-quinone oxidoreductase subunit NuoH [candidate division Zixibacteria bacterium]|nr:NADH-quinone oxidoreductase subunit NuoH [candidate division Zixibacteria bacterium]MBU1471892.1 NADH-quinone oxidoreductase subunit NuoH [candidate division Zixibacteria bacterium]MBU2625588.1 NADH-quinone oxidoreductase subunit NuoH [candidate division Zixibacteria bacterium]
MDLTPVLIMFVKVVVVFAVLLTGCAYMTWLERKVVARIQSRLGPMNAGYHGLLQPVADLIKLLFKDDISPKHVDKFIYAIAPLAAFIPATLSIAVVPFGDSITLFGRQIDLVISNLNIGILYVLGVTSLGVYAVVLAGWSSNSKYSLLGGLRSTAQMISYEIGMGLAIVVVVLLSGSLNLVDIVNSQSSVLDWYVFKNPAAFLIYFVCAVAETNRSPFDLPEAESELVAGYHTEYSSMKFGMYFVGEYANMITVGAIAATLFFGGWQGPLLPPIVWFMLKVAAFMIFYIWTRGTLPRFRYDQLMNFGWKYLLPIAVINVLVTAFFKL